MSLLWRPVVPARRVAGWSPFVAVVGCAVVLAGVCRLETPGIGAAGR